jgi:hypothetical protein
VITVAKMVNYDMLARAIYDLVDHHQIGDAVKILEALGGPADGEEPFVRHTCNPDRPGQPLPWGRKAPEGECARCDQLRAGATPREAPPAIRKAAERKRADAAQVVAIQEHFRPGGPHSTGACGPVCTAFDW